MQIISLTDWPNLTDLERAFYEKSSYENLLSYMSASNIGNKKEYFDEYQQVIKTYLELCHKLEKDIVLPATNQEGGHWEVDFIEKCIKIRENPS